MKSSGLEHEVLRRFFFRSSVFGKLPCAQLSSMQRFLAPFPQSPMRAGWAARAEVLGMGGARGTRASCVLDLFKSVFVECSPVGEKTVHVEVIVV